MEKPYRFRLEKATDLGFGRKIYLDSCRQVQEVRRQGKRGVFKPTLNVRKKDFKITDRTASEYGELLAYEIGKKVGIPTCEADIVLYDMPLKYSKSKRTATIPASISYMDLKPDEELVHALSVLSWYKNQYPQEAADIIDPSDKTINRKVRDYSLFQDSVNCNIPLVINAFEAYVTRKDGIKNPNSQAIRQGLVDMIMFDCKFGNRDRHDENYGLAVSHDGSVRLYPPFDNEYILGMAEGLNVLDKYKGNIDGHIYSEIYSRMNFGCNDSHLPVKDTVRELFKAYPKESEIAYGKVRKFTQTDLTALLEDFEGLDDIHKGYALKIFKTRDEEIRGVYSEHMKAKNSPIPDFD